MELEDFLPFSRELKKNEVNPGKWVTKLFTSKLGSLLQQVRTDVSYGVLGKNLLYLWPRNRYTGWEISQVQVGMISCQVGK